MKLKKTHQEIFTFMSAANEWVKNNPKESKLKYAILKALKPLGKIHEKYQADLADIDIDHCSEDENKNIKRDQRGDLCFTKAGLKARNKARTELFHKQVEIEAHFVAEIPDSLTPFETESFTGFVIEPKKELPNLTPSLRGNGRQEG